MSTSLDSCCLPSVKKQKMSSRFLCSMYYKTLIRFGFCDIQNNQGLGKGYQPQPSAPVVQKSRAKLHYSNEGRKTTSDSS